jgi:aldose 1-epimerase
MKILKPAMYCFTVALIASLNIRSKESEKVETNEKLESKGTIIPGIVKSGFGNTKDGTLIEQYTLRNGNGVEVKVITYGGRITSLKVPNKNGEIENVVLGFDNIEDYQKHNPFFGALIGRYGNRISKGKFTLDGNQYTLATNDGLNHLHGGVNGYDKVIWTAEPIEEEENQSLKLTYLSKDGEEGYPGNLKITVIYSLTKDNTVVLDYEASTDKKTVVNLTQHTYFNLTGDFSNDILGHEIVINSDTFLPVDTMLIPTGEIRAVKGTPFDFNNTKKINQEINTNNEQLKFGKGFDHCWVLNGEKGDMRFVASAYNETSGRLMEVYSEEPAIQFYTGNFLDGSLSMPNGGTYAHRTGFCLETQHYPDSPNQKSFPSVVLNLGETYKTKTSFKFSVRS